MSKKKPDPPWFDAMASISELRLTEDGRWLYGGEVVTHARTLEALNRGIRSSPYSGHRWVVEVGGQMYPLVSDDLPWRVRGLSWRGDDGWIARLNTGESAVATAFARVAEALGYCQLVDGRCARLERAAVTDLSPWIESLPGEGYVVSREGRIWRIHDHVDD